MQKNLAKNNKQPVAMEREAQNMEAKAASGNLVASAAHDAPHKNNAKREQPHLGGMPRHGSGKF